MNRCPYCQAEDAQVRAGRNLSGTQRLKCQHCRRRYTPQPLPDRYPAALRLDAVRLYLSGLSFRAVGRRMNVNHQSIINWVNTYAQALPRKWRKR
jgi:transposase-like protein